MDIKEGRYYQGKHGKYETHRRVESLKADLLGRIHVGYNTVDKKGNLKLVNFMKLERFEKWAKEDVTHIYIGYNPEYGVTE